MSPAKNACTAAATFAAVPKHVSAVMSASIHVQIASSALKSGL
jgi:hypothetical protein